MFQSAQIDHPLILKSKKSKEIEEQTQEVIKQMLSRVEGESKQQLETMSQKYLAELKFELHEREALLEDIIEESQKAESQNEIVVSINSEVSLHLERIIE